MVRQLRPRLDGSGLRIAVLVGRFNEFVTARLVDGALDELRALGVADGDVTVAWAPGVLEIPVLARAAADTGNFDAVVCLGAVIRGETDHYQHVCSGVTRGVGQVALETGVPVTFGVLTVETMAQAIDRAGGKAGNKGAEAARAAVETVGLLRGIRAS